MGPLWSGEQARRSPKDDVRIIDSATKQAAGLIEFKPGRTPCRSGRASIAPRFGTRADAGIADGCEVHRADSLGHDRLESRLTKDRTAQSYYLEQRGGLMYQVGVAGPFRLDS